MAHLLLASTSPRRKVLLSLLGIEFQTVEPDFEEVLTEAIPAGDLAQQMALGKARSVAKQDSDAVVIGADTFVVFQDRYLGKTADDDEARALITELSGNDCTIVTGYAVISSAAGEFAESIETVVHVKKMTSSEIDAYIESGEHIGKAAALSLPVVDRIDGDKSAALGLPLRQLADVLALHFTISAQPA